MTASELVHTVELLTSVLMCCPACLLWQLRVCAAVNPWLCKVMHELLTEQGLGFVLIY
jgi:hypothetical protein